MLLATALAACGLTWVVLRALKRRQILDHPNERSSHEAPTPRGGGIAVIVVLLAAAIALGTAAGTAGPPELWRVLDPAHPFTARDEIQPRGLDEETKKRLRALGYVN